MSPGGEVDASPAHKRSRLLPSRATGTLQREPRDPEESGSPALEPEIIDLTGESSEPEVITINDDESPVVSSDWHTPLHIAFKLVSLELLGLSSGFYFSEYHLQRLHVLSASVPSSAEPGVVISCPICMDFYSEIVQSGRELVSTMCGHVFCSACLPRALDTAQMCPICRVELGPGLYHPIYF
ncbi:RNF4 ligase, partial [Poecile atricapillus]|nr:RNF4 ligase [Poecile atricapillus]